MRANSASTTTSYKIAPHTSRREGDRSGAARARNEKPRVGMREVREKEDRGAEEWGWWARTGGEKRGESKTAQDDGRCARSERGGRRGRARGRAGQGRTVLGSLKGRSGPPWPSSLTPLPPARCPLHTRPSMVPRPHPPTPPQGRWATMWVRLGQGTTLPERSPLGDCQCVGWSSGGPARGAPSWDASFVVEI